MPRLDWYPTTAASDYLPANKEEHRPRADIFLASLKCCCIFHILRFRRMLLPYIERLYRQIPDASNSVLCRDAVRQLILPGTQQYTTSRDTGLQSLKCCVQHVQQLQEAGTINDAQALLASWLKKQNTTCAGVFLSRAVRLELDCRTRGKKKSASSWRSKSHGVQRTSEAESQYFWLTPAEHGPP